MPYSSGPDDRFHMNRGQKILIGFIAFFMVFGIVTRIGQGNAVSDFGYDTFTMVRYSMIEGPLSSVFNYSSDLAKLYKVQNENDALKKTLSSQKLYKAELEDAKDQLKELQDLMGISKENSYSTVYTEILNRDVEGWSNSLTINKGSKDGIKNDMAVICSKGLIGKVTDTTTHTATVRLLTDESSDNYVSVKIQIDANTTTDALLEKYDASSGLYEVRAFDSNVNITKDMKIMTSGSGGVFPSGILVGTVTKVEDLINAKGKTVFVKPSVDFNDINYVAVIVTGGGN